MKKLYSVAAIIFFTAQITSAQINNLADYTKSVHSFLSKNVKGGKVNYKSIAANKKDLTALVNYAAGKQTFGTTADEKAFYLNTYNVTVINGIIKNYPTKGPMAITGFFDKLTYTVNGNVVSLNNIENDIIRKKFPDARVHFALVCGAKSCPPIQSYAFNAKDLDAQLTTLAKQSIQNTNFTKLDLKNNKANISKIFDWYKEDFIKAKGTVLAFLNSYLTSPLPSNTKIEFYDYDWALNTQ